MSVSCVAEEAWRAKCACLQCAGYDSWRGRCGCQQCSTSIIEVEAGTAAQCAVEIAVEGSETIRMGVAAGYAESDGGTIAAKDAAIITNDASLADVQPATK